MHMSFIRNIQLSENRKSLFLSFLFIIATCAVSLFFRLYKLGLPWQEAAIFSTNILYLLFFIHIAKLYHKQAISAKLFVGEMFCLALASFFIARFICNEYFVHDNYHADNDRLSIYCK